MTMGKENMKESFPRNLPTTPFLGHLKGQIGSPYRTYKVVGSIGIPEEIHKMKAHEDDGDINNGSLSKELEFKVSSAHYHVVY
ncbi:hypothetical protein Tco_1454387, partial [Tanacetum coccineum]